MNEHFGEGLIEGRIDDNGFSLLRLVPTVLRARDFRLYTRGKPRQRIVDLWQNGGAAILGHTPPSQLRELKNTASRGLYPPLPHFLEARCVAALSRIFPDRNIGLYAAPPPGLEKLVATGNAALWRPFLDPIAPLSVPHDAPPVLIPVLPGIQGWRGTVGEAVALPLGFCALAVAPGFDRPPGDFLSPVLLALVARGVHDLVAAAPARSNPVFPRVSRALRGASREWRRRGPYLTPTRSIQREEWAAMFRRFLGAGFLIPPVPFQPLILPAALSPGEEARLAGELTGA